MTKFFLVLLFFAFVCVLCFYGGRYAGGKNFEVAMKAGGKVAHWSESKRRRFVIACRVAFIVWGMLTLIFVVVPMVRDIPDLRAGRFEVIEGVPDYITKPTYGLWFFRQTVTINGRNAVFYFHNYLPKDRYYRIYCLKHSRYAVKVTTVPNS